MGNPFVHMELLSTNTDKARKFYGKLFDWELEDIKGAGDIDYTLIKTGEGAGGGIMNNPIPGAPSLWMPYMLVDDLQAATRKALSLGGKLMKEEMTVPGRGKFTIVTDPAGGFLGLWKNET